MLKSKLVFGALAAGAIGLLLAWTLDAQDTAQPRTSRTAGQTVRDFGAVGDGAADDTAAIQRAVNAGVGLLRFPPGRYRITSPIRIELDRSGYTALAGGSVAQIVMEGPGPAIRLIGTHAGTAAPRTFEPNVWERQRTPSIDGLEIVGGHEEACGVEASGTMQLTLTRLVVRGALHAVHLVKRNRNVTLSECHLYDNRGVGVFIDHVDLHQVNIANCHISYNHAGGVVARDSQLRNLQIGTCDIEANMGGPGSKPTANVLLESTGGSVAEVAIVGCSIQHAHDAPHSANIRVNGQSEKVGYTDELRWGHVTIANNVLSDVHVNIDLQNVRGATISGNTLWQGYTHNLVAFNCSNLVLGQNVFERNPRYHSGDAATAKLGLVLTDCSDCTLTGNHLQGVDCQPAALVLRNCRRMNLSGCTILDYGACGLLLDNVVLSRVSDCLIRTDHRGAKALPLRLTSGNGNQIVDNLFSHEPEIASGSATVEDNTAQGNVISE
jgi:uncharacterized protein YjbI with pentapeptide repeats